MSTKVAARPWMNINPFF